MVNTKFLLISTFVLAVSSASVFKVGKFVKPLSSSFLDLSLYT
jgi:hypothetical protein